MLALIYLVPVIALYRYSQALEAAVLLRSTVAVERALRQHRLFWQIAGVLAILAFLAWTVLMTSSIIIPNYQKAVGRTKLRRTVADVRMIGEGLERFARDRRHYPPARSIEQLRGFLEPKYVQKLPKVDGWGRPIEYLALCQDQWCHTAWVISLGSDGEREFDPSQVVRLGRMDFKRPAPWSKNEDDPILLDEVLSSDIVYGNGRFLRVPPELRGGAK